jgi:hypothetical protein
MPSQFEGLDPHIDSRKSSEELLLYTLLATHASELYMHVHRSEYGVGGRVGEADQEEPVVGHACATTFEMLYLLAAVEAGEADASCVDRAE